MTANKKRTYARYRPFSRRGNPMSQETDSQYFLKLVIIVLLGTVWLKFSSPLGVGGVALGGLPVGLLLGILLVSRAKQFRYDRKIWYAMLIVVTIVCYFVPAGIVI